VSDKIVFNAEVFKVQTMPSDQSIRVTFSLPETEIPAMAMLAEARRQGIYLKVTCQTSEPESEKRILNER